MRGLVRTAGLLFAVWILCGAGVLAQTARVERTPVQDNPELKEIFRADQRDRGEDPFDKEASQSLKRPAREEVRQRDAQRLQRVRALLSAGEVRTAQDHVYAAFLLQHGQSGEDYALAHVLATTAALQSQPAPQWARWLAAAAFDRLLHHTQRPQIFGTQVSGQKSADGVVEWTLEPYDRTAVTDVIRKEWCVIPLEQQERMIRLAQDGKGLGPTNIRECR